MTTNQKRRETVNILVANERQELLLRAQIPDEIRNNPVRRAVRWAEGMAQELKKFGDGTGEAYLKHFVFDSNDGETSRHHHLVHDTFRNLVGIEFIDLSEERELQTVVGEAALYGWANSDSVGVLRTVSYEAVRLNSVTEGIVYRRQPVESL